LIRIQTKKIKKAKKEDLNSVEAKKKKKKRQNKKLRDLQKKYGDISESKYQEAIIRYKLNSYERIEERFRDKNIIQLYLKQNPDVAAVVEKNLSEADKNKEKETLEKIADKLLLDDDVDTESISSDLSE